MLLSKLTLLQITRLSSISKDCARLAAKAEVEGACGGLQTNQDCRPGRYTL